MKKFAHCEISPLSTSRDYPSEYALQNCHGWPVTTSLKNGQIKAASKQKVREMKGDEMIQGPKKCKAAKTCFETDTFPAFLMP